MIVERADLAGARLSLPRPGRRRLRSMRVVALVTWLVLGLVLWWGSRATQVDLTPPPDPQVTEPGPGLHGAYVARRAHHLSQLLPQAFPPAPVLGHPPPGIWRSVLQQPADRALVVQITRNATVHDPVWVLRDPVIGQPRGRRIEDDEMLRALRGWAPTSLPELPDRGEATLASLVEESAVQLRGTGRPALFAAPEGAHVVDRAVRDVLRYAELRRDASEALVAAQRARARAAWAEARPALLQAQAERAAGLRGALGIWAACGVAGLLAWWALGRRRLAVVIGPHHLMLGQRQLLWEEVADLWWYPDEVGVRRTDGSTVVVGGLALRPAEVRALERECWPLWARDRAGRDEASEQALRELMDLSGA